MRSRVTGVQGSGQVELVLLRETGHHVNRKFLRATMTG